MRSRAAIRAACANSAGVANWVKSLQQGGGNRLLHLLRRAHRLVDAAQALHRVGLVGRELGHHGRHAVRVGRLLRLGAHRDRHRSRPAPRRAARRAPPGSGAARPRRAPSRRRSVSFRTPCARARASASESVMNAKRRCGVIERLNEVCGAAICGSARRVDLLGPPRAERPGQADRAPSLPRRGASSGAMPGRSRAVRIAKRTALPGCSASPASPRANISPSPGIALGLPALVRRRRRRALAHRGRARSRSSRRPTRRRSCSGAPST